MGTHEQKASPPTALGAKGLFRPFRSADRLVILALMTVVCLVSLPRLASFVTRSNEWDARRALALLGPSCCPSEPGQAPASPTDPATWTARLRHQLGDARPLEDHSALLYHGYLFALRPGPGAEPWLVAWPRQVGRTGDQVYAWSPDGGAMTASDACRLGWSGDTADPAAINPADWNPIREIDLSP